MSYTDECFEIAAADPRWSSGSSECACRRFHSFVDPKGGPTCPVCWNWLDDLDAPSIPLADPERPKAPLPTLYCPWCCAKAVPLLEWRQHRVRGEARLHLGAFCATPACKHWLQWMSQAVYESAAPARPVVPAEVETAPLFVMDAGRAARTEWVDTSGLQRESKKVVKPLEQSDRWTVCHAASAWQTQLWKRGAKPFLKKTELWIREAGGAERLATERDASLALRNYTVRQLLDEARRSIEEPNGYDPMKPLGAWRQGGGRRPPITGAGAPPPPKNQQRFIMSSEPFEYMGVQYQIMNDVLPCPQCGAGATLFDVEMGAPVHPVCRTSYAEARARNIPSYRNPLCEDGNHAMLGFVDEEK